MSGMPLVQALLLLASLIALIALTQARLLHAFLAIVVVATAFGLAAGFSTAFVGKAFGAGFAQAIYFARTGHCRRRLCRRACGSNRRRRLARR